VRVQEDEAVRVFKKLPQDFLNWRYDSCKHN
jgi:hypothetical protein